MLSEQLRGSMGKSKNPNLFATPTNELGIPIKTSTIPSLDLLEMSSILKKVESTQTRFSRSSSTILFS